MAGGPWHTGGDESAAMETRALPNGMADKAAAPVARRRISGGPLVGLLLSAALIAAAATYVVSVMWPRWPGAAVTDAPSLPITVAGVLFNVPPAALRIAVQRHAGAQERIDLAFLWPSLDPPDPAARPSPNDEPQPFDRLFVTIAASEGTLAPVVRFREIYPRYLGDGPYKGPDGLAVSLFRDGTPYQNEDLFFDTEQPHPRHLPARAPGRGSRRHRALSPRLAGRLARVCRGHRPPDRKIAPDPGLMSVTRDRSRGSPSGSCRSAPRPRRRRRARR